MNELELVYIHVRLSLTLVFRTVRSKAADTRSSEVLGRKKKIKKRYLK